MAEAAEIEPDDRVLEVGAGSGYGAAVLGRIAAEVWTIERHERAGRGRPTRARRPRLRQRPRRAAATARSGWPEQAPFDAIVVTAGGPVGPAGAAGTAGRRRPPGHPGRARDPGPGAGPGPPTSGDEFDEEDLGPVRFVPADRRPGLRAGDRPTAGARRRRRPAGTALTMRAPTGATRRTASAAWSREAAEPFGSIDAADLGPLLERIGDCPVVLLGEASHGTSEFYRMRARITRELIARQGLHRRGGRGRLARRRPHRPLRAAPPAVAAGAHRLQPVPHLDVAQPRGGGVRRVAAATTTAASRTRAGGSSFYGLDLYSLYTSRRRGARLPRPRRSRGGRAWPAHRYGCLTPVGARPGRVRPRRRHRRFAGCEAGVVATLTDLLAAPPRLRRRATATRSSTPSRTRGGRQRRALLPGDVLRLGRAPGTCATSTCSRPSRLLRAHRGPGAKVVVWEHNSHIGDASATEMGARGEHNVGQLCRRRVRRRRLPGRLRHRPRHRGGRRPTGAGRCSVKAVRPSHARQLRAGLPRLRRPGVPARTCATRRRPEVREELADAAAGAGHRRDLPARDRAAEPLLPGRRCRTSSTSTSGSTRRPR